MLIIFRMIIQKVFSFLLLIAFISSCSENKPIKLYCDFKPWVPATFVLFPNKKIALDVTSFQQRKGTLKIDENFYILFFPKDKDHGWEVLTIIDRYFGKVSYEYGTSPFGKDSPNQKIEGTCTLQKVESL